MFALRVLAKSPAFTAAAVALLAIGIGANAVVFSAFDNLLLRPLPVRDPEQLVRLGQDLPRLGLRSNFNYSFYKELRDHSQTLETVFGEAEFLQPLTEPAPAEEIRVRAVTPEFFETLGVPALVGRALTRADADETQGEVPAVLSYGFWRRRFHGDPRAVGRMIALAAHRFTIVGVMPREFNGIAVETTPEVRVPIRAVKLLVHDPFRNTMDFDMEVAGRLRPGITRDRAEAECRAIWRRWLGATSKASGPDVRDLFNDPFELDSIERGVSILRDRFGGALQLLIAAAGLLQLLLCANLAGLLLAHGAARREEMAVRLALGATRARLMRQLLLESALLAVLGCAAGLIIAYASAPLLMRALPPIRDLRTARLSLDLSLTPDRRVLLYSLTLSALTTLLFGLAPAASASRTSLDSVLRSARTTGRSRTRQALLIFQIALCTMLLAGAGLLVRTFQELHGMNPGFDRDHIVTFTVDPALLGYTPEQSKALLDALEARVRQMPGVIAVGDASRPLMRGSGFKSSIVLPGHRMTQADFLNSSFNTVSPEYFDAMGMRIVEGRGLAPTDSGLKPQPVVVNQAFARHFFPNSDPIGKCFGERCDRVIIGVVTDAKYRSLREPISPVFYEPATPGDFVLHVRTAIRPEWIIAPVRQAMAALAPGLPIIEVNTLAEEVDASAAPERLTAALASIFASIAALMAAVGIYGLFAYTVAQRRREIGIRMALGAQPGSIGGMIGREALWIVAPGVAAGLIAARAAAPLARALLYGITPSDAVSFTGAAVFVTAGAAIAAAIPAMRAARVEPASALRMD